jgi:NAD(P)-dependent dehydrogenase (short-subunit alcohol dehydrogenase family)
MSNKIALVTGAGTGIGKASALALMKVGFTVVLAGRREQPLAEVVTAGKAIGGQALAVVTDVADPESVAQLFATVQRQYGRLDVLFNNAGSGTPSLSFEQLTVEQWRGCVEPILTGTFLCMREAFTIMKDQNPRGGRIINNGSISAYSPRPGSAPYSSAKHGVSGLTKAGSLDGRKYDIAVGQLDIGNAATDMTARMANGVPQPNGQMMIEPRMDVTHVANAVVYMAQLPLDANVQFMTVMATKMPFVGRG